MDLPYISNSTKLVHVAKVTICIREVPDSSLGQDIKYTELFRWFFRVLSSKFEHNNLKLSHENFLPYSLDSWLTTITLPLDDTQSQLLILSLNKNMKKLINKFLHNELWKQYPSTDQQFCYDNTFAPSGWLVACELRYIKATQQQTRFYWINKETQLLFP